MKGLLTETISQIVKEKIKQDNGFGVSIVSLPDIDYLQFIALLGSEKKLEIYFLGYDKNKKQELQQSILQSEKLSVYYSVEEAEESRNLGAEDTFRIHFIKNTELEKLSSLRWYDEIDMELVYKKSCKVALSKLAYSNDAIKNLLQALARKDIRAILNFERVLDYLEALIESTPAELPSNITSQLYRLGLLADSSFAIGSPTNDQIRESIKRNFNTLKRISSLEKVERRSIANYAAKNPNNTLVRSILRYYREPAIETLKEMELSEVEKCLKVATTSGNTPPRSPKKSGAKPTVATSQMIFDGKEEAIDEFVEIAAEKVDNRPDKDKNSTVTLEFDGIKVDVQANITTEALADFAVSDMHWGGIIKADVNSPKDALDNRDKYSFEPFNQNDIDEMRAYLERAMEFDEAKASAQAVLKAFDFFMEKRKSVLPYTLRLQDMPMLQVASKCTVFSEYLSAYEKLLSAIRENFSKLQDLDSIGAKNVIAALVALDVVYIVGRSNSHAIPTPLNPLYLWKYIKLAEEMINSKGIPEGEAHHLSETDKDFIIRKAEDIPDPLALIMLPKNEITTTECLPFAGRIGCMPIYSTKPQVSDNDSGLDSVKREIIRYMCLYPHSSMMLRISIINPPSVDCVVDMLKKLDKDKEFSAFGNVGVDLSIYRTKETSSDWVELKDKVLNDGMLGKVKGKKSGKFNLSIKNKCLTYPEIIKDISREQHIIVIFDPNEKEVGVAKNSRNIHIHPLCVPKVYEYNKMRGDVKIRAANEGGIFADYASIVERLYDQPSALGHRNVFEKSPLQKETYTSLLEKADWLMILDQSLKTWDVSLQSTGERLFYKGSDYRSLGIYSKNSKKFALGYNEIISGLGNYVPTDESVNNIISATRSINDDGLLSIVSHSTNQIFDKKHGQGSLGLALTALKYKAKYPDAVLVGLDTQLAREWLSEREEGKLPDLIGIRFNDSDLLPQTIDLIEVKTYAAYSISDEGIISGRAVQQAGILEDLIVEMFGKSEKITTISRREILREQVFEGLFNNNSYDANQKQQVAQRMNSLFAGEYAVNAIRRICHVDFSTALSSENSYNDAIGKEYILTIIGAKEIQALLSGSYDPNVFETNSEATPEEGTVVQSTEIASTLEREPRQQIATAIATAETPLVTTQNESSDEIVRLEENDNRLDIHEKCVRLNVVLKSYGIQSLPVDESLVQQAARFTRFKLELKPGETEANLKRRSEDIARELEAVGEIFISRIKGTRYIGVDVPFSDGGKVLSLTDNLYRLADAKGALPFLAGQSPDGEHHIVDLARAPHMLVAGTTGSGKSVFLNAIAVSLIDQLSTDELELVIIDPKQMEFHFYNGLPYLRNKQVYTDPEEAIELLEHIRTVDMPERIEKIKASGSKDIASYNEKNPNNKMKYLVVVIDEYSALVNAATMQGKKVRDSFEKNLCSLVFMARSFGIHVIVATQYPTANYVTSALKANLPFRVSFKLPSHTDSQTILDRSGAEDLLGKGDMLMLTDSDVLRMQGFFIPEQQVKDYIDSKKG